MLATLSGTCPAVRSYSPVRAGVFVYLPLELENLRQQLFFSSFILFIPSSYALWDLLRNPVSEPVKMNDRLVF